MEKTIFNISIIRDTTTVLDTLKRVYNPRIRRTKTGYRLRVQPDKTSPFMSLLSRLESDGFIRIGGKV
ncbi:MAG: hypothetical protein KDK45_19620 [Leptospiraceae bacterium]|nr:hypothetical protein [Leptospiraceae bacterium]